MGSILQPPIAKAKNSNPGTAAERKSHPPFRSTYVERAKNFNPNQTKKKMNSTQFIIQNLPEQFTRKDVLETAKQLEYSFSTANSFFEKALYKGLIQRTGAGEYKKTA